MTCKHVLDIVDARGLVDVSTARVEAARLHARGCAACDKALAAAESLATDLAGLARPTPLRDLGADVMRRIAAIAEQEERTTTEPARRGASRGVWAEWAAAGSLLTALGLSLSSAATVIQSPDDISLVPASLTALVSTASTPAELAKIVVCLVLVDLGLRLLSDRQPSRRTGKSGLETGEL